MNINISKIIGLMSILFLAYCTGIKPIANVPDDQLLRIANKRWPDATKASLTAGQVIYNQMYTMSCD